MNDINYQIADAYAKLRYFNEPMLYMKLPDDDQKTVVDLMAYSYMEDQRLLLTHVEGGKRWLIVCDSFMEFRSRFSILYQEYRLHHPSSLSSPFIFIDRNANRYRYMGYDPRMYHVFVMPDGRKFGEKITDLKGRGFNIVYSNY